MPPENNQNHDDDQNSGFGSTVVSERKPAVKKPSLYKVLIHNDDYTPMDFVVMILETYFGKDKLSATEIMLAVHHKGVGVCGTFPFEIAETKVMQVMECARENEHPLQCTMEKL